MKPLAHRTKEVSESQTFAIAGEVRRMRQEGIDVVSFALGEPDFPSPRAARDAAVEALEELEGEDLDLEDVVKALRPVLPMKFEKVKIAVKVPSAYAHRCYGTLKGYGIEKEQWLGNGDLVVVVEIFGGLQGEFFDKLNKLTAGQVETKLLPL